MILNNLLDKVIGRWKRGEEQTHNVGFKSLSNFYNVMQGSCTDWSGYPTSGKTELLLECLMNLSNFYGHVHMLYMPDAGEPDEIMGELLSKYCQKPFNEFYYSNGEKFKSLNRITEKEIMMYTPEIEKHFKIINQETKQLTPLDFWKYAAQYSKENKLHSAVIDSWNYMKHDIGSLRYDQWLESTLSARNQIAAAHNLHFHTIIHPKSAVTTKEGIVTVPTAHSLKGGSEWYNNGKSIIVVDRDDFQSRAVKIYIQKAKPKSVGNKGEVELFYDVKKSRYYEDNGINQIYAIHPSEQLNPITEEF